MVVVYLAGNTTNMMFHLDHEHKEEKSGSEVKPIKAATSQPKINTWCGGATPGRLTQKDKDAIDDALMKLLVKKALPTSLVDNPFFRDFVALLEPRFVFLLFITFLPPCKYGTCILL